MLKFMYERWLGLSRNRKAEGNDYHAKHSATTGTFTSSSSSRLFYLQKIVLQLTVLDTLKRGDNHDATRCRISGDSLTLYIPFKFLHLSSKKGFRTIQKKVFNIIAMRDKSTHWL